MSVVQQLYRLQELDLEIESNEQTLKQIANQLGKSDAVAMLLDKLKLEQERLSELKQQQHSLEWEIDDITNKANTAETELYSGRIRNPKELSGLQQEVEVLKAKRNHLEDKTLEIMDQVELATIGVASIGDELKTMEEDWKKQQVKLLSKRDKIKSILSDLVKNRQTLAAEIDPTAIGIYQELRKQWGTAVARVEQGICRGCRISLPVAELRQARSGNLARCSSCGRIIFMA